MDSITLQAPQVITAKQRLTSGVARNRVSSWVHDVWLVRMLIVASALSVASWLYFYVNHDILLYGDAHSHLMIARRVILGTSPGLAQLGGVWLPLPHLILLPLIWNNFLWSSGLAGSFTSMPCFVAATTFLFLTARRLTHDDVASFLGALVFSANPNILYMQSTPLTEPLLYAVMAAAGYWFVCWAQEGAVRHLVWSGIATLLAISTRYEGWAFFLALILGIVVIGVMRRLPLKQIFANIVVFGAFGALGIGLWLIWNVIIFHDILFFQRGPYSAQVDQQGFLANGTLFTYHSVQQSLRYFGYGAAEIAGPLVCAVGILGFIAFVIRRRLTPELVAGLIFFAPVVFQIYSLYSGQIILYVPNAVPAGFSTQLYNDRYCAIVMIPLALMAASLVTRWPLMKLVVIGMVAAQAILTSTGGIITLQDGQTGVSCLSPSPTVVFLAQHYDSGRLLETYGADYLDTSQAGIDLSNIVYVGSYKLYADALRDPAAYVDWIVINPSSTEWNAVQPNSTNFTQQFTPVFNSNSDGFYVFRKRDLPPMPDRSIPATFWQHFSTCGRPTTGSAQQAPSLALPSRAVFPWTPRIRLPQLSLRSAT